MNESEEILNLISEKSELLQEELMTLQNADDRANDHMIDIVAEKIALLEDLYEEIKIIVS
jgi:hypothetical protein